MDTNSKDKGNFETKRLDSTEQMRRFKDFVENHYYGELLEIVRLGKKSIPIDFSKLIKFDPELSEEILENPEDLIKACELTLSDFDVSKSDDQKRIHIRFFNLPKSQNMLVRNIRSEHIGRFIHIEGVVRQKSDVRPQVTTARFECPACGNIISVIQLDTKFKEPSRCGCGRKGKFFLLSKELVDAQGIVLEEASENLEGGEQPKRMNVFLKEDLVSPLSDKKTNPGTKITVNGYVKEIPISLNSGGTSTRYDLLIEANFVDSSNEEFSDIIITKEEEEEILELAANTNVKELLIKSVAPSIYGHDRIKEALLYQMVGGVKKDRTDGVSTRGDMHILLIGDPGAGKCLHGETKIILSDGDIKTIKEIVKNKNEKKINLSLPGLDLNGEINNQTAIRVWSREEKELIKIKTRTGKEIKITKNHPLFTLENGFIISKEAKDFKKGERIIIPRKINVKGTIQTIPKFKATRKSNNSKNYIFPEIVNKELARLCGYLCRDRYLNYSKTSSLISLTNNDDEILNDFKKLMYLNFSANCTLRKPHKGKTSKEIYLNSFAIAQYFEKNFTEIFNKSNNKTIPELILKSENDVLKEFIKSLFECDCHVNQKKRQIEFTSISRELIEQIQLVLLRFGIVSSLKKKIKFATNTILKRKVESYEIIISGNFFNIYKDQIGLISLRKKEALKKASLKKINTNIDLIPNTNELLKQKRIEYNLNQSQMGLNRSTYCHYEQNNRLPSFDSFIKIANHLNDSHLLTIANSNIFFDEILEIKNILNDDLFVYDLEVSKVHNYIANAIVVHNSQLLKRMAKIAPKARFVSGKGASLDYNEPILIKKNNIIKNILIGELIENNCVKDIENKFLPMKEKTETLAFNPNTLKLEWKEIKYGYRHKPKEKLFHVTLETGRNIKITKDHSVFMLKNGKVKTIEASKLKERDVLLIPKHIKSENNIPLPEGLSTLLGYYIAEGHIRNKNSSYKIEFTLNKKETDIYQKINDISKKLFDKEAKNYKHGENGLRIIIYGKKAHDIFKKYLGNTYDKKAKTKRIPEIIFNASKKDKLDFINAYIEGDYGVTKSKYLMSDLMYLYLQINKIASFNERNDDKETIINKRIIKSIGKRYDLKSINKEYSKRYEKIPFEALDKEILENYCKNIISSDYKRLRWDKLSYLKLIDRIMFIGDQKIISGIELRKRFNESVLEYINENKKIYNVTKKGRTNFISLTKFGLKLYKKLKELKTVFESDFGFTRIKTIERIESSNKYVYDVSVPGYENFVGGFGGIICHNSGAGLCVSPNSKLLTNPGGIESIKQTVDSRLKIKEEYVPGVYKQDNIDDIKIQSMSNDLKIHSKNPKSIWKLKSPKYVYEINLSSGKKIELTGNTQLFTIKNGKTFWKKSMDLKKEEYIATPRKLISGNNKTIYTLDLINSNPVVHNIKPFIKKVLNKLKNNYTLREISKKLNLNENNLYHNWINEKAKGNIKLNSLKKLCEFAKIDFKKNIKEISLYNGKNHKIPLKLSKNFYYVAGLIAGDGDIRKNKLSISIRLSNNDETLHSIFTKTIQDEFNLNFDIQKESNKRPKSTRFNSKILGEILFNLGIPFSPKSNKLKFSNKLLHLSNEYLSEFISGLYDSDGSICIRNTKGSNTIEYYTCSEEFIRELQLVLLRYGIHSKIRSKEPTKGKIKGNYLRWILEIRGENIKTFAKNFNLRKDSKKNKLKELLNQQIKHNTNIDIIPNIGFEVKKILKQNNISLKNISKHNNYSREYLINIIKKYNLNELKHLCDNDIFWEKIIDIKIKKPNYEYVYDLTVEDSHNFVVDGVLVHNTAAVVKDEFLKGWSLEAGALVLANKGICLTGDTDIITKGNKIKKIKEIYNEFKKNKKIEVLSINDKNYNVENVKIKNVSKRIPKTLLEIKFDTGQILKITPEHPVPYWNNGINWKPIGDLSKGDSIFNTTDYSKHDFENKEYSNEMLEFAGLIATDGHISKIKNTIRFYTKDYELFARYIKLVTFTFGIIPNIYTDERSGVVQIYFSSKKVISFLNKLGIERGNKSNNGLSIENIYNLKKELVKSFLIGVINGDGCISNRKSGAVAYITCGNKKTCNLFQKLLFKLGIISRVETYKAIGGGLVKKRETTLYRNVITGNENILKLKDSRLIENKRCNIYNISKKRNNTFPFNKIDLLLKEISSSLPKNKQSLLYKNNIRKHKDMKNINFKKETLKKALNHKEIDHKLKNIVNSGAYLSKIVEIKKIKPEEVYNIQTECDFEPNYFANFIPVHNCMIDELDKMSEEDRSAMHEALEGQCYHPETEIRLSDGSRTKIGNLVEENMKNKEKIEGINCEFSFPDNLNIITTDFNQIFETKVNRVSRHTPPKYFIQITFQNGRTIKVTPEHPVWVYHNFSYKEVPAALVTKEMLVPAPKKSGIVGEKQILKIPKKEHFNEKNIKLPNEFNEDLASFLGYFITEGHSYLNKKNRYAEIGISTTSTEIKGHIIELFKNLFQIEPNLNIKKSDYNEKSKKELYTIRCSSKMLYKYFELNFPELLYKAPLKRVPNILMKERKSIKINFLKYSFAGDGFIDKNGFGFSTSSNKLAEDFQDLMLDLGIQSFIRNENQKYFKTYVSSPEGKFLFYENLVPELDHRKERLNYFCNLSLGKANYRDPVSNDMLIKVKKILNKLHIDDGYYGTLIKRNQNSQKSVVKKYISLAQEKINNINSLNQTQLVSLLETEINQISSFLEADIKLIGITEIKKIVENVPWVYDVTILPNQTFISQGVILHNTITISKANIQATLRAETTVLAAANPKFGRFDPYDSISKQIDLPPALINRFDLIFAIKDLPDREKDEKLASFILGLHMDPKGKESEIPTSLIRKYIAYAKQNLKPGLTEGAIEEIKSYYLKMRHKGTSDGEVKSIPISPRQLEGLVRISEACAKLRLSKKVSRKDAKVAVDLLHYALTQIGVDPETGEIDIDRIATGISSSERNKIVNVREIISRLEESLGRTIPIDEIIKAASEKGMSEEKVEEAIEKLKKSGDIFEPRRGFISRI
jgi:replicative DNA helicase Mcm